MIGRYVAGAGGVLGLASLALPYGQLTSTAFGFTAGYRSYTLFGLAGFLRDTGQQPLLVYGVAVAVVAGSLMSVASAFDDRWWAFVGGVLQGVAAAAFVVVGSMGGALSWVFGFATFGVKPEIGVFALVGACVLSLVGVLLGAAPALAGRSASEA